MDDPRIRGKMERQKMMEAEMKRVPEYTTTIIENPDKNLSPEERVAHWSKKLKDIERIADGLGMPVDAGIKEAVAGLQIMGIPTSASCEGHVYERGHGKMAPWVDIAGENEPQYIYEEEKELKEQVFKKYGGKFFQLNDANQEKALEEYDGLLTKKNPDLKTTQEWKEYKERQKINLMKVFKLLDEFYAGQSVAGDIKLILEFDRVHNGGVYFHRDYKKYPIAPDELGFLSGKLASYQAEMRRFTEFLKNKYFAE